jgi:hypothetical protein
LLLLLLRLWTLRATAQQGLSAIVDRFSAAVYAGIDAAIGTLKAGEPISARRIAYLARKRV